VPSGSELVVVVEVDDVVVVSTDEVVVLGAVVVDVVVVVGSAVLEHAARASARARSPMSEGRVPARMESR